MPYLRPMATVIHDSINYGIDEDGGSIHDVIGTRCDPYTYKAMTGQDKETPTCHTNLAEAIKEFDLKEDDVHDVFNIFMCSGFTRDRHEYFVKVSDSAGGSLPNCMLHIGLKRENKFILVGQCTVCFTG